MQAAFIYGGDMINDTTNTTYDYLSVPIVEGGVLNEQGVMNVALSFFDLTRNIVDDAAEKEVVLFKQILAGAEIFCISMSDWTFQTRLREYDAEDVTNDDPVLSSEYTYNYRYIKGDSYTQNGQTYVHRYVPYRGLAYAYRLPNDFLKIRSINADPRCGFQAVGNNFYCNALGCSFEYISTNISNVPMDFGYMVAYKCAVEMAQHLDPEGTAMQRANAMLSQTYAALKQRDDLNVRLENPPQDYYIDHGTKWWGR